MQFDIRIVQEYALFEPGCRHVAKDIMGTNRANPAAMILSATMMLRHLGYVHARLPSPPSDVHAALTHGDLSLSRSLDHLANNIASATFDVINAGKVRTARGGRIKVVPRDVSSLIKDGAFFI